MWIYVTRGDSSQRHTVMHIIITFSELQLTEERRTHSTCLACYWFSIVTYSKPHWWPTATLHCLLVRVDFQMKQWGMIHKGVVCILFCCDMKCSFCFTVTAERPPTPACAAVSPGRITANTLSVCSLHPVVIQIIVLITKQTTQEIIGLVKWSY